MDIILLLLVLAVAVIIIILLKAAAAEKINRNSLQESLNYANMIIDTVPNTLLVLDAGLNIVSASLSFYKQFNYRREDIERRSFFDIFRGKFDYRELKQLLTSVLNENDSFDHYEIELAGNRIVRLYMPFGHMHAAENRNQACQTPTIYSEY